jgi:hypothetical protein
MRRTLVLGMVTALVLSAAGCSGGLTPPRAPTNSGTSNPPSAAPSASSPPTPADPSQPAGPDQLGDPVVTRSSAADGDKVKLTLYPVVRDGAVSHVNLELSATDEDAKSVQISSLLSDANTTTSDSTGDAADGLQLVDGKNKKLYLVASDGKGRCLCSRNLNNLFLDYGNPVLLSASFAAPPADVSAVQVRIPSFGTVKNVPVQ